MNKIIERLELVAEQYPNSKHRQLRTVIRETIAHLSKNKPPVKKATPKPADNVSTARKVLDYLEENGPKMLGELREGLPNISGRTIEATVLKLVSEGAINATHSRTKTGKVQASRTYSSAEWDAAATRMRADIASSWMRNPVIQEAEDVQD